MPFSLLSALSLSLLAAQQALTPSGPALPERWPVAWSTEIGAGFARPVVSGEVLYVLTRGEGAALLCVDVSDGRVQWRVPLDDALRPGQEEMGGRAPHADPLVVGDSVLALGFGGGLTAVAAVDGAPRWRVDLVEALGAQPVQFGFAASPVAVDRYVVVAVGAPGPGYVALEPLTGAVAWSSAPYPSSGAPPQPDERAQGTCGPTARRAGAEPR